MAIIPSERDVLMGRCLGPSNGKGQKSSQKSSPSSLGGGFKYLCYVYPDPWGDDPI